MRKIKPWAIFSGETNFDQFSKLVAKCIAFHLEVMYNPYIGGQPNGADRRNKKWGQSKMTTQTTGEKSETDVRETVPVLMSAEMKIAVENYAKLQNRTVSGFIRDLVGAEIGWDMSNENRKPRTPKYATDAERIAAKKRQDAERRAFDKIAREKYRAELAAAEKKSALAAKRAKNKTTA